MIIIYTIIAASVVLAILSKRSRRKRKESGYPSWLPSPSGVGAAGLFETIAGVSGLNAPFYIYNCYRAIPPGKKWIGRLKLPFTKSIKLGFGIADATFAKEVLYDSKSTKPPGYEEFAYISFGQKNIMALNGKRANHARKGLAPAFASKHIKRMDMICNEQLDHWMEHTLDPLAEKGASFDVANELIYLTLSIICEAGFEYEMRREEMDLFLHHVEICAREFIIMNPFHKRCPWLFPAVWRAKRSAKILQSIVFNIMANYKENWKGKESKTEGFRYCECDTIISRIMSNSNYPSDEARAADVLILLIAGHDTTAYSVAWAMIDIARNNPPELMVYRKKASVLPREEWKRVDELQYVIKESMRLNPVAAMGPARRVGRDFVFQDGNCKIVIPKDSFVWANFYPMFRNPEYYDNPDEFQPSRWLNPKTELAYMPFALGARNCPGKSLASAELNTFVSVLSAKYDFTLDDEGSPECFLTLKPSGARLIPHKLHHSSGVK